MGGHPWGTSTSNFSGDTSMARMTPFNTNAVTRSKPPFLYPIIWNSTCVQQLWDFPLRPWSCSGRFGSSCHSWVIFLATRRRLTYTAKTEQLIIYRSGWHYWPPLDFKYIVFNIHWREWSVSWNSFGSIAARVSTTRKNGRIDMSQLLARCWRIQLRKTYMRHICDEWKIRLTCQCSND